MALSGFDHAVEWDEFTDVEQRPDGADEDAKITARWRRDVAYRRDAGSPCVVDSLNVSIYVSTNDSWVVSGKKTAALLQHEQGHYDITALGARELYNRILNLSSPRCDTVDRDAQRIERDVQRRINVVNRRYDRQTVHGTDADTQRTWERSIRDAKRRPAGTLADLPD